MATQLVANLAEPFEPEKYTDDYRANLMKIIGAKMNGQKIEIAEPEREESTKVLDLMSRLQASLEQSSAQRRGKSAPSRGTRAARESEARPSSERGTRTRKRRTA